MGAKGSKPEPKPEEPLPPAARKVEISLDKLIDPADPAIFPEPVRNELMAVKEEVSPSELFKIKEFDRSSKLVEWLHQCKSYFAYEGENSNNNSSNSNNSANENENSKQRPDEDALAWRLRLLMEGDRKRTRKAQSRGTINKPHPLFKQPIKEMSYDPSLYRLPWEKNGNEQEGGAGVERDKNPFLYKLSGLCDTPNIELKFLANLLEVADRFLFAFLNTGHIAGFMIFGNDKDNKQCLHRYVTCTGPRKLGIGIGLVKEVHAIAKREGYTCVTLGASDSEGFHKKMGYVATGKSNLEGPQMIFQLQGGKTRKRKTRRALHPQARGGRARK